MCLNLVTPSVWLWVKIARGLTHSLQPIPNSQFMPTFRHVPLLRHVLFLSHISVQPGITSSEYSTLVLVILFPCSDEDSRNSVSIMHPMNLFRRRTEGCVTLFAPRLGGKPPKYIGLFTISPFFSRLSTANFGRLSKYIVVLSLFLSTNTLCQAKSFKFSPRVVFHIVQLTN